MKSYTKQQDVLPYLSCAWPRVLSLAYGQPSVTLISTLTQPRHTREPLICDAVDDPVSIPRTRAIENDADKRNLLSTVLVNSHPVFVDLMI